jgi:hypothetical protein
MSKWHQRFKRRIWCASALATLLLLVPSAAPCQSNVQVRFELQSTSVTLHEPVYLILSVRNELEESITFGPAPFEDSFFNFSVLQPDGSIARLPSVVHGGIQMVGPVAVAPGTTYTTKHLLNDRYQFDVPGNYVLRVSLGGPVRMRSGTSIPSSPQSLTLSVAPRDPKRLEEVCQGLAEAAAGSGKYSVLSQAAVALGYVEDPIAVPYLGKVLAYNNLASNLAVDGLVRIGGPKALQILKSNLDTANSDLATKIQWGIYEIKRGAKPGILGVD